ncbi:MAG TPA: GNAT family N-acetyltransferase [Polyangiales bacterium]|nr:GNAT family N-acetyltransferase [Polyangiales bacterium]
MQALIERSARALSRDDYSDEQIEAALGGAWGVDSQLIRDRSYFIGEHAQRAVACGGWSWRKTLFGGDAQLGREPETLDPRQEAARIRAFFVDPEWARIGLGRVLLELCEREARAAGFSSAALVATLPGERLYAACGYQSEGARSYPLGEGKSIVFVPMRKLLG